jgi:hypothetical protein
MILFCNQLLAGQATCGLASQELVTKQNHCKFVT